MSNPPSVVSRPPRHSARVARRGAVLVECLVSLLLLAGAAALLQLIANTAATSLDHALQVDATVGVTDLVHQRWLRGACASGGGESGMGTVPVRLNLSVTPVSDGTLRSVTIRASWMASTLAVAHANIPAGQRRDVMSVLRCDP